MNKLAKRVESYTRVVAGTTYVGKLSALKCKKCDSVWHDPDEAMQLDRTIDRVAKGLEAERANAFDVHRTHSVVPR